MRTKSGTELTDRDLDALAREAEAGYDLTKAKRRRVGRPSLSHGTSPRVQFRIDLDLYERAKEKAASESKSMSDVGRELFSTYAGRTQQRSIAGRATRRRTRS